MTHPTLTTARLTLQPLALEHAPGLFPIYSSADAMRYWYTPPHRHVDETASMVAGMLNAPHPCAWVGFTTTSPEPVAVVQYILDAPVPGMGYIVHPAYWRQGYGTEMVTSALDYGFNHLRLNRVELWIDTDNLASQKLAYRTGFAPRGQFYQRFGHHTHPHENRVFGLRADEWAARTGQMLSNVQREMAFFGISPVLQVADVAATLAFYRDRLGFQVDYVAGTPPTFAIVGRGEWSSQRGQIHLEYSGSPAPPGTLYFRVGTNIDALHDTFLANGVKVTSGLLTQPWGSREFTVEDNNGWRLRFATAL